MGYCPLRGGKEVGLGHLYVVNTNSLQDGNNTYSFPEGAWPPECRPISPTAPGPVISATSRVVMPYSVLP